MVVEALGCSVVLGSGVMVYAVRGRSSRIFGPSVHRGPKDRAAIALTFDDGPSESTPRVLEVLDRHGVPATFFQVGAAVRRLPTIAREVTRAGHEIGNHSDSHRGFYLRSPSFVYGELARAQDAIEAATGVWPAYFRAPYGARWFGLREAQRRLGLMGVMWTVLGLDWKLRGAAAAGRLLRRAGNGAILCLHDGRDLQCQPDIRETVAALRLLVPALLARGFRFATIGNLLCPTK